METKKLEALLMSVDLGSFTRAAEVLGYTQSGLTHMMNSLEREVGFQLLDRGRTGVRLSEDGARVAPAIRDFLQANARLDSTIERVRGSRTEVIHVSAYASMATQWLPMIIQKFRALEPEVDVDIRMADRVDSPYELLSQGKMDIIFASRQQTDYTYDWVHLRDDQMYAVLPMDYPLEDGAVTFPLEAFSGKDFIMPSQGYDKDIMRVFDAHDVRPNVRPTMVDDATVVNMVEHGLGISMMSELTLQGRNKRVILLPVVPVAARELGAAVRALDTASPALLRFLECTKRVVAALEI